MGSIKLPEINLAPIVGAIDGLRDNYLAIQRQEAEVKAGQAQVDLMADENRIKQEIIQSGDYANMSNLYRQKMSAAIEQQALKIPIASMADSFRNGMMFSVEKAIPEVDKMAMNQLDASATARADMDLNSSIQAGAPVDQNRAIYMAHFGTDQQPAQVLMRKAGYNIDVAKSLWKQGMDQTVQATAAQAVKTIISDTNSSAMAKLQDVQKWATRYSDPTRPDLQPARDVFTKAIEDLKPVAIKEHKDQGMAQLAQTVSVLQPLWSRAKLEGQGFDPTPGLKTMLKDPSLDTDVREAVNTTLKNLTLEADRSLSKDASDKLLSQNLDSMKNRIQVLLKQGANSDYLDAKIIEWMKAGAETGLDPRNYSEAVAFAKGAVGLESDQVIKGVMDKAFKDLPPDAQTKLQVRFKELAGGLYNRGDSDAFKANGRWKPEALASAAADMAKAEKEDAFHQILSQDLHPDTVVYDELVTYVDRAATGKLIGQVDASNVAQRTQIFTDALYANLKTNKPTSLPQGKPSVEFNLYTSAGLPTYVWPDGTRATPVVKDKKIDWQLTGGRFGRK